jgi:hypothetical protein
MSSTFAISAARASSTVTYFGSGKSRVRSSLSAATDAAAFETLRDPDQLAVSPLAHLEAFDLGVQVELAGLALVPLQRRASQLRFPPRFASSRIRALRSASVSLPSRFTTGRYP